MSCSEYLGEMLEAAATTTGRETPLGPGGRPLPGHSIHFRSVLYTTVSTEIYILKEVRRIKRCWLTRID
jgi:hypothetical protein